MKLYELKSPTENPKFKAWFGNSIVVGWDGKPLPLFHGTDQSKYFSEFFDDRVIWAAVNPSLAEVYAKHKSTAVRYDDELQDVKAGYILPVYMRIEKPFDTRKFLARSSYGRAESGEDIINYMTQHAPNLRNDPKYHDFFDEWIKHTSPGASQITWLLWNHKMRPTLSQKFVTLLKHLGFDGIVFEEDFGAGSSSSLTFGAFSSNQVKSAIGNIGNYSLDKGDITESSR